MSLQLHTARVLRMFTRLNLKGQRVKLAVVSLVSFVVLLQLFWFAPEAVSKEQHVTVEKPKGLSSHYSEAFDGIEGTLLQRCNAYFSSMEKVNTKNISSIVTDSRVYTKCYVDNNSGDLQQIREFAYQLYPWCTQIKPVVKASDGTFISHKPQRGSFFQGLKSSYSGKGIVIPVFSRVDLQSAVKLITVLRFLNVGLPLQVVHRGNFGKLIDTSLNAALTDPVDLNIIELDNIGVPGYENKFSEITDASFVNLNIVIEDSYKKFVDRSTFKSLAILYSTFDDVILLDPQTIPMRALFKIFASPLYKQHGAYFFANYMLDVPIPKKELTMFQGLFPTNVDTHVFGIPSESESSQLSQTRFSKGKAYTSSEDVIFINSKKKLSALLLSLELRFFGHFESSVLDDDLLYLGMAMNGDDVPIHEVPTGVVGSFTRAGSRMKPTLFANHQTSREICSTHRGYLSRLPHTDAPRSALARKGQQNDLLFITGGVQNCDNDNINAEEESQKKFYKQFHDPIKAVRSRAQFHGMIIPREQELAYVNPLNVTTAYVDEFLTDEDNLCDGQMLCAYDLINSCSNETIYAASVLFDSKDYTILDLLSKIWTNR